jgi:hypothetical protein
MVYATVGCAFGRVTVLTGEDAVGLETVTEVRGEWHKVHACLVETAIYDVVTHFEICGVGGGICKIYKM